MWQLIVDNCSHIIKIHTPCKTISCDQNGIPTSTETIHSLIEGNKLINVFSFMKSKARRKWQGKQSSVHQEQEISMASIKY
jgi:hypothetical protein